MSRRLRWLLLLTLLGVTPAGAEPLRLDRGTLTPNLLDNPSVERGEDGAPRGWTFEGKGSGGWESGLASRGNRSLRIDGEGSWRSAPFPLEEGKVTLLWGDTRLSGSGRWGALVRVDLLAEDGSRLGKIDPYRRDEHSWLRQRSAGIAPPGTVRGVFVCRTYRDDSVTAWCDDMEVRQWSPDPADDSGLEEGASGPADEMRRFDFGTPTSMVQPGYTGVDPSTRYRDGQGYGWVSRVRLEGRDQTHGRYRPSETNAQGQPVDANRTFLDPRTRDYIAGVGASRFRVDVPPGLYRVFLLGGHSERDPSPPYFDLQVTFGKQRAGRLRKRWPQIAFAWDTFEAEAGERGLTIGLSSGKFGGAWALSTMIVYPVAAAEAGEREAAGIQRSVEALPEELLLGRTRLPSPWAERRFSDDAPGRGSPRILEGIWPGMGDPAGRLQATASPGLFADLRFTLATDETLEGLSLAWAPFATESGEVLPEDAVILWHLRERFLRYTEGYVVHDLFVVQPDELTRRIPSHLPAEETSPLWMRVRIPPATPAGTYSSRLQVTVAGGRSVSVPLSVRVLPFEPDAPQLFQNVYLHGFAGKPRSRPTVGVEKEAERLRLEAITDAADHLGNPALLVFQLPVYRKARGGFGVELAFLRETLEDRRKAGVPASDAFILLQPVLNQLARLMFPEDATGFGKHMKGQPELTDEYWTVFGDLSVQIDQELQGAGVERRLYNPWDESFGDDLPIFIRAAAVLRERLEEPRVFCNVPTTTFYGGPSVDPEHILAPHCNAWWVYGFLTQEQRRAERARGTWLFGRYEQEGSAPARAASGVLRWYRQELGGNWWAYDAFRGSASTHLDGPSWADRCLVYPKVPPAPRLAWEWTRVGHEDLRYLVTLEGWVAAAQASPLRAAQRAARRGARVLEDLRESIDGAHLDPLGGSPAYDDARNRVVAALLEIHEALEALEQGETGDSPAR